MIECVALFAVGAKFISRIAGGAICFARSLAVFDGFLELCFVFDAEFFGRAGGSAIAFFRAIGVKITLVAIECFCHAFVACRAHEIARARRQRRTFARDAIAVFAADFAVGARRRRACVAAQAARRIAILAFAAIIVFLALVDAFGVVAHFVADIATVDVRTLAGDANAVGAAHRAFGARSFRTRGAAQAVGITQFIGAAVFVSAAFDDAGMGFVIADFIVAGARIGGRTFAFEAPPVVAADFSCPARAFRTFGDAGICLKIANLRRIGAIVVPRAFAGNAYAFRAAANRARRANARITRFDAFPFIAANQSPRARICCVVAFGDACPARAVFVFAAAGVCVAARFLAACAALTRQMRQTRFVGAACAADIGAVGAKPRRSADLPVFARLRRTPRNAYVVHAKHVAGAIGGFVARLDDIRILRYADAV